LCHAPFDFDFERGASEVIPRPDLQAMMFTEMQELLEGPGYGAPSPARTVVMAGGASGGAASEEKAGDEKMGD